MGYFRPGNPVSTIAKAQRFPVSGDSQLQVAPAALPGLVSLVDLPVLLLQLVLPHLAGREVLMHLGGPAARCLRRSRCKRRTGLQQSSTERSTNLAPGQPASTPPR